MRYIDVEKIRLTADTAHCSGDILVSLSDVRSALAQTPTADVVEVIHGEWKATVLINTPGIFKTGAPHCSECNKIAQSRTAFCPHCGAKMDRGGNTK